MHHPSNLIKYILPIIILYICLGCQEYYAPDVDVQTDVLVIEGTIKDTPGPDSIKLSMALPYDERSYYPPVYGAKVMIIDSKNREEYLVEKPRGMYYTSDNFTGIIGESYVLQVETPDGNLYRSDTVTLLPVPCIESMYANYNEKQFLKKNLNGDYTKVNDPGMDIRFDLPTVETDNLYLRFEWFASIQYQVVISTQVGTQVFHRKKITSSMISTTSSVVNVLNPNASESRQLLGNHLTFFGMSQMNPPIAWGSGGRVISKSTQGVVIFAWLYSIEEKAFKYWENIKKQIYAEGKLFDPLATQVCGNIKCISDPSRLVLGYFSTSSGSNYSFYAYLRSDNTIYSRKLDIDPDTLDIRYDSILPPIWIWPEH